MQSIIMTILGLLVGVAIAGAGIFYLIKEKKDKDSVKIYRTISLIGAAITIGIVVKIAVVGL